MVAVSFLVGAIAMRLVSRPAKKQPTTEDPRNHRIRELEADLRASKKEFVECQDALEVKTEEFETAVETLREVRAELSERTEELEESKGDLKGSVAKTRELRTELQDRATATIREQVRAEEAETELEVARAGSEAVLGEINRLQEERKNLTDTMSKLEESLLPDEDLFGKH